MEKLQFIDYVGMSTAEHLQIVLRSGHGEQTTNNEELLRIEEERKAQK